MIRELRQRQAALRLVFIFIVILIFFYSCMTIIESASLDASAARHIGVIHNTQIELGISPAVDTEVTKKATAFEEAVSDMLEVARQYESLDSFEQETETYTEAFDAYDNNQSADSEPELYSETDYSVIRIEPKTDIEDYYSCRDELIRRGVSECGGEPYLGMIAVFQVMYDRMYSMDAGYESIHDMLSVQNAFAAPREGDISPWEPEISKACEAVFLNGERVFDVPTKYFYNPKYSSEAGIAFMEAQAYVGTIGNHVFRTEWKYFG